MKLKRLKQAPILIAGAVLAFICGLRGLNLEFSERLEAITYDGRARLAARFPSHAAENLGFVFINEASIRAVKSGELGYQFGLYWPRQVYGRLVQELAAQGAKVVGFDVIFGELRGDHHAPVVMANGDLVESDDYFARTMRDAGNVIIAYTPDLPPPSLFATNCADMGDISTEKDVDGVLRRARAFQLYTNWHPAFQLAESDYGFNLSQARIEPGKITLVRTNETEIEEITIALDTENQFDLADFIAPPPGTPPKARAFTVERVWHLGVVLAARHLGLNLETAQVDLPSGRITLRNATGMERIIPVDANGYFYIDWVLSPNDPRLTTESIQSLLRQNYERLHGTNAPPKVDWREKLVVVGSSGQVGNELTDRGATPIAKDAMLVGKHWNVANSILTGRFVRRASFATELLLIVVLGSLTAFLTWQFRVFTAAGGVFLLATAYCAAGVFLFVQYRYWLPLVLPIVGAMLVQYFCLVTYRVVFEQRERRRVKSIFSKVVAPDVMNELLGKESLSLYGTRREVTVLFADVRGFTELTDYTQERVAEYVREKKLSHEQAEACFDEFAAETLKTVNTYLTCVMDAALAEGGTFDKLIGDCVMFFWGAPVDFPRHARACVRAAIEAQRAIYRLNQQRAVENQQREAENRARESAGLPPRPPLATLTLGTGINTGMVTAGIMGADAHQINYTVFGREVNLASRLEGMSGRGRIFISEATYRHLQRDDPALAATCIEREPMKPKGFNRPVQIYEVPWMPPGETVIDFQTILFAKPGN